MSEQTAGSTWRGILLLLGLLGGLVLLYLTGVIDLLTWETMRGHLDDWQTLAREHPLLVIALFVLAYIALTSMSMPAAPLLCLSGALFDWGPGACISSGSSVVAATVLFLASRHLFRDWLRQRFAATLEKIDAGIDRDGAWYLLALRLCPMVPFTVVNASMALTSIRLRTFALVSWLGMLPACLLYANAGSELGRIQTPEDALTPSVLVSLVLLSLLPLAVRWVMHQARGE